MNIVIIANFTRRLDGERESRFSYLADAFSQRGHNVELIISDFSHGTKRRRVEPRYDLYSFKITKCHEPGYRKNISIKRLYSHYIWGRNVFKHLKNSPHPDVVYCAIPSLTAPKLAAKYCKHIGAKFVTDVQDLWPEAFYMVVHNKLLQKLFIPMQNSANQAYASSDLAIAVSDTYVERTLLENQKGATGVSVFLGNDGGLFGSGVGLYNIKRNHDELLLCYIGSMSDSYDIPCVVDALALVEAKKMTLRNIRFVLIGQGPSKQHFEQYAAEKHINCSFMGNKPYVEMAGLLSSCDICINPIVKGSAASIINKVGDYALSGLPVINTQESPEYRKLVDDYGCGINCICEDAESVANAIVTLAENDDLRKKMGQASLRLARDKFDRRYTYNKIIEAVEKL